MCIAISKGDILKRGHIFFPNRLRGWHRDALDSAALHETNDGGHTWQRVLLRPPRWLGPVRKRFEQTTIA
jgi:hypothetical protein